MGEWAWLTVCVEDDLVGDRCPQLVGCEADVFALVLFQGVHAAADGVEDHGPFPLRHLELRVAARVKPVPVLSPSETRGGRGMRKRRGRTICQHRAT